MNPPKQVALLIETSNAYARNLLRGIMAYVHAHGPWTLRLAEHGRGEVRPSDLAGWHGHGIIARVENRRVAHVVQACACPSVDVSAARLLPQLPWVETDDDAVARAAADHLLERGLRHFGYCGDNRFNWSLWRAQHFARYLADHGFPCHLGPLPRRGTDELAEWIHALPKPVGIMACYDIRAREVLAACRQTGASVPDQVAVIGVDDDELLCELCDPPLSSVLPDARHAGWVAAQLLDQAMSGRSLPPESHLIPPLRVTTRRSSDTLAVEDPDLASALRFIREHACDGISVANLLEHVPLSRRVLESRFQNVLGRSPHAEILRVRLERVKTLLIRGDWSLDTIARHTGFRHGVYLSTVFKRELGETPSQFRARQSR